MDSHFGKHGTSIRAAKSILGPSGFRKSPVGRHGGGVYFWAYENGDPISKGLARRYSIGFAKKVQKLKPNDIAVINCELLAHANETLDLCSIKHSMGLKKFQQKVLRACNAQDVSEEEKKRRLNQSTEGYIKNLEISAKKVGLEITVRLVHVMTELPPGDPDKRMKGRELLGLESLVEQSACVVARDVSCIKIIDVSDNQKNKIGQ